MQHPLALSYKNWKDLAGLTRGLDMMVPRHIRHLSEADEHFLNSKSLSAHGAVMTSSMQVQKVPWYSGTSWAASREL